MSKTKIVRKLLPIFLIVIGATFSSYFYPTAQAGNLSSWLLMISIVLMAIGMFSGIVTYLGD